MKYKIGFIGGGNMAKAIIGGLITSGTYNADEIIASDKNNIALDSLRSTFAIEATTDNEIVVKSSEIVLFAVKPHLMEAIIEPLKSTFTDGQLIISIAAGLTSDTIKAWLPDYIDFYRVMPNTPASVGAGMSVIFSTADENEPTLLTVKKIFESVGIVEIMEESLVHACIAIQGSSPAYMFMMLEAMGDAGVMMGLPRDKAYTLAAQSMLGSAQMLLETKAHPGILKDMVTSPRGTTIEAVAELEAAGFRSGIIEAMKVCAQKSEAMSKKER